MSDQRPSPWKEPDLPRGCGEWAKDVDRIMLDEFCINLSDAGADRADVLRYWKSGQSPADFVDWFGEKYGLLRFELRYGR